MKEKIRRFINDLKLKSKSAVFIALAAIGLTLLISGLLDIMPKAYGSFGKILAGIIIIIIVGYMGYGILGKNKK